MINSFRFISIRIIVLALFYSTSSLPILGQSAEEYFEMGKSKISLLNQSENKEAIRLLTKAITIKSDYEEAFVYRARAYSANYRYEEALNDISEAIELSSEKKEYYLQRAHIYKDIGMDQFDVEDRYSVANAIKDYTTYIRLAENHNDLDANYYVSLNIRSELKYKLKDYRGALSDINKLIKLVRTDLRNGIQKREDNFYSISTPQRKLATALYDKAMIYHAWEDLNNACLYWSKAAEQGFPGGYSVIEEYCQ